MNITSLKNSIRILKYIISISEWISEYITLSYFRDTPDEQSDGEPRVC